jgi:3-oxoacyl-[acyl-carrier protein] reductase
MDLTNRVAVVTGASRSLGREIALELARRGADVVVNYAASAEPAEEVAAEIRGMGRRAFACHAPVQDFAAVKAMMQRAADELGRIDVLVNNAGVLRRSFLMMTSEEDFTETLAINLTGSFHCIKAVSRQMIKQRSGAIVNISSLAGLRGLVGQGAYAASKGGLHSLTVVAAKELSRYGVRVNAVAPGVIDIGMMNDFTAATQKDYLAQIPLGRPGRAEEVSRVVAFLASDDASYITGHVLPIDGGMYIG